MMSQNVFILRVGPLLRVEGFIPTSSYLPLPLIPKWEILYHKYPSWNYWLIKFWLKRWQSDSTCSNALYLRQFFIVVLLYAGRNQVSTFLSNNNGPGVQHIAFHTSDIISTTASLRKQGLSIIFPPVEYYSLPVSTDFTVYHCDCCVCCRLRPLLI